MTVGLLSFGTNRSVFNGGKSQIGLNFSGQSGSGDFPFINIMKMGQMWSYITGGASVDPSDLDSNGYPTVINSGGIRSRLYVPTQAQRPGRYVIKWDGAGTIYQNISPSSLNGSFTSVGGVDNRVEFTTSASQWDVGISAIGSPRITNIRICHVDDEALLDAGEVFGVLFKQKLQEANPGVIRFLDWQNGNTTNVTTWSTRKPESYVFWCADEPRASLFAGTTTNSGDDYSITFGSGAPVDKQQIIVKFNASATGTSPTLNLNGMGALPIVRDTSATLTTNGRPLANFYACLTYDADLNKWLKAGGDTNDSHHYLVNGVPIEVMLQLCEETGAHPYFVTPYLAVDPATDYMSSLADYVKQNGAPWMVPRFEGCNETWNGNTSFKATTYGGNKAVVYWGGSSTYHQWYGKIVSVLGQMVSTVYADDRSKYMVCAGVQTALTSTAASDPRLTSAHYVAQAAAAQSPFTKTPASDWATHVCVTTYITPTRYSTLQELTDGYAYAVTNVGNAVVQLTLAESYADTLTGASLEYNLAYLNARYVQWKAWADSYGLGLTAYEGGYSPDYSAVAWTSPVTGATQANPCVLTLATTSGTRGAISGGGNAAVVGMSLSLASVGGMTQLNGNTYTVSAINVGGDPTKIAINVDATGFSAFTSGGTATYVNAPLYTNTLRYASKFVNSLETHTTSNYTNFVNAGGVFPSQFFFCGSSYSSGGTLGGGQVWGVYENLYDTPSPAINAIIVFNN